MKIQAKKGDIVEYRNLTLQDSFTGVVVGRNKDDNGFEVVRLTSNGQPFVMAIEGVHFDNAFDSNIYKVYPDAKDDNGEKLFPNH